MLTGTQADIVFLLDESGSESNAPTQEWLATVVSGDLNRNGALDAGEESLATKLAKPEFGITDLRYGLIGFGQSVLSNPADPNSAVLARYAHSQLFVNNDPESLFGDPSSLTTSDLNTIFDTNTAQFGGTEDGWDAIEHAIAEYDFRDGAAVIFVLVQNDEGRAELNSTLTRPGVLAALNSNNAILNVLVPGVATSRDNDGFAQGHEPLFNVHTAGANEWVLGVESDPADMVVDQLHDYYGINTATHNTTSGQFDDTTGTLDFIDGEMAGGAFPGETEDAYVRLAWDTGGAAWDVGVVEAFNTIDSPEANALNDAFINSLGEQINRAHTSGNVFRDSVVVNGDVLLALNLGSLSEEHAGAAGFFRRDDGTFTDDGGVPAVDSFSFSESIDLDSTNSIPDGNATELQMVFQSARGNRSPTSNDNLVLTIDRLDIGGAPTVLANGTYIVELFFAEPELTSTFSGVNNRTFDVRLEGDETLVGYQIHQDFAKIVEFGAPPSIELDSAPLGQDVTTSSDPRPGVVKRFEVEVTDGALDIEVVKQSGSFMFGGFEPILNAVRILEADPPRVEDVVVKGNAWAPGVEYSLGQAAGRGDQLRPVYHSGVDVIEIHFDGPVNFSDGSTPGVPDGKELVLRQSFRNLPNGGTVPETRSILNGANDFSFVYDPVNYVGTWTFDDPLDNDKYAIELSSTITGGGQPLDGEWNNHREAPVTYDDFSDDLPAMFPSGNGVSDTPGDAFRFHFSVLSGDYNQDGVVDFADQSVVLDGDGDGVVEDESDWFNRVFGDDFALTLGSERYLPFSKLRGDLNDDETVDPTDWAILRDHFGLTPGDNNWDERADVNDDGVVDLDDYILFREAYLELLSFPSAWNEQPSVAAALFNIEVITVSTTVDELDGDLSDGDLSLREAIHLANSLEFALILLPEGVYQLSLLGTEAGDASVNDLDVTSDVRIVGDGAGVSVVNAIVGGHNHSVDGGRIFQVDGQDARLELSGVSVIGGYGYSGVIGSALLVENEGELLITDSTVASNWILGATGANTAAVGADLTIRRSVFTHNAGYDAAAVWVATDPVYAGSLTIGESIFALNVPIGGTSPAVGVAGAVALSNEGDNLYDDATGGFFDTTPGTGDYLGTPDYVVTSVADTFDHSDGAAVQSIREAVDLANTANQGNPTNQPLEIWLPAWGFVLTRDRATYGGGSATDTDVAFGDLDISESLVVRGIEGRTAVRWKSGVQDKIFELLGDYNYDGDAWSDQYDDLVYFDDSAIWAQQNGSSGAWEQFSADGDDDGDVDQDDYDLWQQHLFHTLDLIGVNA